MLAAFLLSITVAGFLFSQQRLSIFDHRKYNSFSGIEDVVIFLKDNKKQDFMGNLLYIVAVILIIGWLVGFFGFHAGNIIHALLVIAFIAIIIRLIQGRSV